MKKYSVEITEKAKKQFKKLDRNIQVFLLQWIRKKLEGCENPRIYGKALKGDKARSVEI